MKRQTKTPRTPRRPSAWGRNFLAGLVATGALGFLYLNCDPAPAGADPESFAAESAAAVEMPPADLVFDEPVASTPGTAGTATTVVTAAATTTTAGPVIAPRNDRKITALVRLLLEDEGIDLPGGDDQTWDDNRFTILTNKILLQRGLKRLEAMPSYSATFFKQERVDGVMLDAQVTRMKVREAPFSVYMKWIKGDKGRELLYVDGQNDGKLIVHAGGWKARLVPALKLDPKGSIAMAENRHPVTMAGIRNMILRMLRDRDADLANPGRVRYRMNEGETFNERPCFAFMYEHLERENSPEYRKCIVYIDAEFCVPVFVKNYGWPHEDETIAAADLDEETLVEQYHFTELDFGQRFADADFDRENKEYRFRR